MIDRRIIGMTHLFQRFVLDDSGQDLIEYALVAAIVALGSVAAVKTLGNGIGNAFNGVQNSLSNAVS
jgi:pilus assembly protein Flp/PilA